MCVRSQRCRPHSDHFFLNDIGIRNASKLFHFVPREMAQSSAYFDDEARRIFARGPSLYSNLDCIFEHPVTKGKIFIGNQTAAQSLPILTSHGITHVVNCTNGMGELPNYHEGKLTYFRFHVSDWQRHVGGPNDHGAVLRFTDPLFEFIDGALSRGENVLGHCLAGAHRAGTTGCACLIHYRGMDVETAIITAKSLRPIIDPICGFPQFLQRLRHAEYTRMSMFTPAGGG
jgi:protein-tyrosine phosphatase